ncbi:glycoside hydrolase family 113 [Pararhodonellum marinum]|uniref:glycoside hydrolase family 113 n=1 Tax=Pararhodonellum marinum TaxID=2755358 RepID=UPI00188F768C|nr:hypothetical protein [Pararhodonellum marinum]
MINIKRPFQITLLTLLGLGMVSWAGFVSWSSTGGQTETWLGGPKQKGVCWVGSPQPLQGGELEKLAETGTNFISQTPFGWQTEKNSPEIKWEVHSDRMWWGERLLGLEETTQAARDLGIESILKPHLWVRGAWPGEIEMNEEASWDAWFANYESFILYYAQFAQENEIPVLCIGTELEKSSHREQNWRKIIEKVREVYDGQLVYAANFTEFEHIRFWDQLDFIGIQAYFPLSEKNKPNLSDLKKGWNKQLPSIEKIQQRFQKPVIFTEIGYCNTSDAAQEPWIWPNERKTAEISEEIQALCYRAFFESVWPKPWLAGVYFWKWYPDPREREPDFTPQNKAAERIMREFFTK